MRNAHAKFAAAAWSFTVLATARDPPPLACREISTFLQSEPMSRFAHAARDFSAHRPAPSAFPRCLVP
eukprot:11563-Chlamydomonas_euryale.AAC.4